MRLMKLVVVESPYGFGDIERNLKYARLCMRDCISRGEAPIASHLLYTQPHVLNDDDPDERKLGIEIGYTWGEYADTVAFYVDLGVSSGMRKAQDWYKANNTALEKRNLPKHLWDKMIK